MFTRERNTNERNWRNKTEFLNSRDTIKTLTARCIEPDDLQRRNNLRTDGPPEGCGDHGTDRCGRVL